MISTESVGFPKVTSFSAATEHAAQETADGTTTGRD
jgi:hypothetical protein